MAFRIGEKPNMGATPAAKLHGKYNRLTAGNSRHEDWKTILIRGVSYDEADCLINYIENRPYKMLPSSKSLLANLKQYLAEAAMDPVAQRYGVTAWAAKEAEYLHSEGNDIPPEYLQRTKDDYTSYLGAMQSVNKELWLKLPTPSQFAIEWYAHTARYGSLRMRLWHSKHPKFRQYMAAHCRAAGLFAFGFLEDARLKFDK